MNEARVYLDTSMLVKRYVKEEGSEITDEYFRMAQRGEAVLCLSEINLGEAAVVFDKYSRRTGIDARVLLETMLSELERLERSSSVEIYPVDSDMMRRAIKTVLTFHIFINDAIQLETCAGAGGTMFCSADRELNSAAGELGIATVGQYN